MIPARRGSYHSVTHKQKEHGHDYTTANIWYGTPPSSACTYSYYTLHLLHDMNNIHISRPFQRQSRRHLPPPRSLPQMPPAPTGKPPPSVVLSLDFHSVVLPYQPSLASRSAEKKALSTGLRRKKPSRGRVEGGGRGGHVLHNITITLLTTHPRRRDVVSVSGRGAVYRWKKEARHHFAWHNTAQRICFVTCFRRGHTKTSAEISGNFSQDRNQPNTRKAWRLAVSFDTLFA